MLTSASLVDLDTTIASTILQRDAAIDRETETTPPSANILLEAVGAGD